MTKKSSAIQALRSVMKIIMKIEGFIMVVGCAALVIAILVAVVCRYWLYIATPWSDELARYSFLWIAFIGMGYVTQDGAHIDVRLIDSIINKKAKNPEKAMKFFIRLSQVLTLVVLAISTVLYYQFFNARYPALSTALRIPMRIPYMSVMVGLALMCLHELSLLFLPVDDPMGKGQG